MLKKSLLDRVALIISIFVIINMLSINSIALGNEAYEDGHNTVSNGDTVESNKTNLYDSNLSEETTTCEEITICEETTGCEEFYVYEDQDSLDNINASNNLQTGNSVILNVGSDYIEDGVYAFQNVAYPNMWMDIQNNSPYPGAHVQQYYSTTPLTNSFTRSALFKITRIPNTSTYSIRLMLSNRISFEISEGSVLTKSISTNDGELGQNELFYIEPSSNGYTIRPCGTSFVIASAHPTASGASGAPNSYLTTQQVSQVNDAGKWTLVKYTGSHCSGGGVGAPSSWRSMGISTGEIAYANIIGWSTHIGMNAVDIDIHSISNITGKCDWNVDNYTLYFAASRPGVLQFTLNVKNDTTGDVGLSFISNYNIVPMEGTYFVQNNQTNKYIDIEGPSSSQGAYIQQWDFSTASQKKWIIEHVPNSNGYIKLKSVYSNLYIGVDPNDTSLIRQYSDSGTNDNILWKMEYISTGNYKFICKLTESSSLCLALPTNVGGNGVNLTQSLYTNDTNKNDEWNVFVHRDVSLIGIPEGYDRTSYFGNIVSDLQSIGYNDCYSNHSNIDVEIDGDQLLDIMGYSSITLIRTHGSFECVVASDRYLYKDEMSEYIMRCSDLILFGSCSAAEGGKDADNMVYAAVTAGARSAIGFENSVNAYACNRWCEKFFEYYSEYYNITGKTLNDVLTATDNYMKEDNGYEYIKANGTIVSLRNYVICGEETFPE